MTPERWQQIKKLFHEAVELEPNRRAAFLDSACMGQQELRSAVEALIRSHERAGSFIESPAFAQAAELFGDERPALAVGDSLGIYRIVRQLGKGGMGEVYLADDTRLKRQVALKILPISLSSNEDRLQRFEQEARAASSLNHPNIITIYEIGAEDGARFIATEFIEGVTLRRLMRDHQPNLIEALDISVQIASALAAAHERGIIHRDIKPENIMIRRDGFVKVLDFGLAKLTERKTERQNTGSEMPTKVMTGTEPGMLMGTTAYMSPEQARGLKVDARTDIWSLGVVLYEMIAEHVPFEGETNSDIIASILKTAPPPLSSDLLVIPTELVQIIFKALGKEREARYQTASELLSDLRSLKQELEFEIKLKGKEAVRSFSYEPQSFETHSQRKAISTSEVAERFLEAPTLISGSVSDSSASSRKSFREEPRSSMGGRFSAFKNIISTRVVLALIAVLILGSTALFFYRRQTNLKWAMAQIPRIEELAQAQNFFAAYDLAIQAQKYLLDDPTITRLMPEISLSISITSEPAGARVFLKRFAPDQAGNFPERQFVGTTPIKNLRVGRGDYVLYVEMEGYARAEQVISGVLWNDGVSMFVPPPTGIQIRLAEAARVPDRMTFVPDGDYRIVAWRRPTDERVHLDDFLIDRYEVTNQEYKEFVNAGGYLKKQFWKYPFIKQGKTILWEEAMREFIDRTGLPGPRSWSNQNFPEGQAQHPVTDITWYEAAAYAEFRGKKLPTIFQWEKAARNGQWSFAGITMPWGVQQGATAGRANFSGGGTVPVDSYEFGMSPYGCFNMAGNAAEWLLNETSGSFFTGGGSWGDLPYVFGYYGTYPGLYSSNKLGFRCVLNLPGAGGDQGAMKLRLEDEAPSYTPASESSVNSLLHYYEYERTPLDAQVTEVLETDVWRRERISYNGADGERAIAYLYLPKNFQAPYQVIHYMPAGDVFNRARSLPDSTEAVLSPFIKSGRAVFAVVFRGFIERDRPPDYREHSPATVEFVEDTARNIIDARRGLDYLETRGDIDAGKISYFTFSSFDYKVILPAVEPRYRAVMLSGCGIDSVITRWNPAANLINFVQRISAHKLVLHGRYDEAVPLKNSAEPLFRLLREPKKLSIYEGGHVPPQEVFVPVVNAWLDETMGAVRRE